MFGKDVNATTNGNVCTSTETCKAGTSTSLPGGFETPSFVAVDGSAGPSAGDIYVGDAGDHRVSKFSSSGVLVTAWGTGGQRSFPTLSGLALNPTGQLFVRTDTAISEFAQDGTEQHSCEPFHSSPNGIAVDSTSAFYQLTAENKVEQLTAECESAGQLDSTPNATGIIVDSASNFGDLDGIYVDQGGTLINHFAGGCSQHSCEPVDSFGTGHLSAARGIAITDSGTVYVANTGAKAIAVFPDLTRPELGLTARSAATPSSITFSGTVEPDAANGGGEITECQFEYVDQTEFESHAFVGAATVPCSPSHFSTPTEVSANVTGLTPKVPYHYRLFASNSQLASHSEEETFTSPTHVFTTTFGAADSTPADPYPLESPGGVAADPITGDLYVTNDGSVPQQTVSVHASGGSFNLAFGGESTEAMGTGTLTAGSTEITELSTTTGDFIDGEGITGPGIQPETTISEDYRPGIVTLSKPATASHLDVTLSGSIPYNASHEIVQNILRTLNSIGENVTVRQGPTGAHEQFLHPYLLIFTGPLNRFGLEQITANGSGLTGASPTVAVATISSAGDGSDVEKFTPTGEFLLMFGKEVNKHGTTEAERDVCTSAEECQPGEKGSSPGAFERPTLVAVDPSSGPSAGDVYVGDSGEYVGDTGKYTISKFSPSGQLITSWGSQGLLTGMEVDDNGNLWVGVYPFSVLEYNQAGGLVETYSPGFSTGFTVAPSGDAFYAKEPSGTWLPFAVTAGAPPLGNIPGGGSALTVAPDGFPYDISGEEISEFEPSGKPFGAPFGLGSLAGPSAVAVNEDSNAYVANSAAGDVSVFESVAPGVTTGSVEHEDHTKVTVTGEVNPLGHGEITECSFEYVTAAHLKVEGYAGAATVPCSAINVKIPTYVTAELTGLTAEVEYHYRIDAGNANGKVPGVDHTFMLKAVFGVETAAATEVKRRSAQLNGSLNPDGIETHYRFEYVEAAKYHSGAPNPYSEGASVEAANPVSGTQQNVSQTVSALQPQTTYHYRLVAENEDGTTYGQDETVTTLSSVLSVTTDPATAVQPESAVLHGTFTGDPEGGDTQCYFRYGTDTNYGHTTSQPPGVDQGNASGLHEVEAEVSGLSPRHTYHFSLVCQGAIGITAGADQQFETPEAPTIDGLTSANLTRTSATLKGAVNPQEYETVCRFEYGTSTNYGHTTPCPHAPGLEEGQIGSGSTDVPLEVHLEDLQVGFVYHFRLVASNKWGTAVTEDQTFTFYPSHCPNEFLRQETNSSFLPDCRAYELVSPGNAGSVILGPGGVPSSSYAQNPTRFAYFGVLGEIPGGESPNYNGDVYFATRTPSGWVTHYVGLLGDEHPAELRNYLASDTLEQTIDYVRSESEQLPEDGPYAWDDEGHPLGQWPSGIRSVPNGESTKGMFQPSPDFSHLAFSSSNVVFPTEHGEGQTTGIGSAYDYDTKTESTELISVLPGGGSIPQAPGYSPGPETRNKNIIFPSTERAVTARNLGASNGQSVSTDGSHILMGTPGKQEFFNGWVPGYPCTGIFGSCETGPGLLQLYMRVADTVTYCVSCKADGEPAEVEYIGMTPDGSTVYFMSEEQLTPEDHDTSVDLYRWSAKKAERGEPAITLVSKGNQNSGLGNSDSCQAEGNWTPKCGVMAVRSGSDGDTNEEAQYTGSDNFLAENGDIYFYSPEQLDGSKGITGAMNLYDYIAADETLKYVATFHPSEECAYQFFSLSVNCANNPIARIQVTPNDSRVAFITPDQVTSYNPTDPDGYCSIFYFSTDKTGGIPVYRNCEEMYTYEASTGKIVCVSCNPSGAPPTHDVSASTQGLFMANDGRTFFSTVESLVQTDTNEVEDVYEYVEGRPQLITTGTDAADQTGEAEGATGIQGGLAGVSANGVNAYFATRDTLVPQDHNGQYIKFYDARIDGGFPINKPPLPCESADECHGSGSSAPTLPHSGTVANQGSGGNARPESHPAPHKHKARKHKKRKRSGSRRHRRAAHHTTRRSTR